MLRDERVLGSLALAVALSLSPTGIAEAQPTDVSEEARAQFMAGTAAFDEGDYELAVSQFQAAYDATEHPDILFNIYSAAERAGQLERAEEALRRYLAEGEVEADRRPVLQTRLARLHERVAARAGEPEPEPIVEPEPEPEPMVEPEPEPAPSGGVHPAGIGLLAGGGALLVSFAIFAGLSEAEDGNLADGCGATGSCADADLETLSTFNIVADVSWIGGAALAVTGLILLLVLPADEGDGASAALAPWVSPDGVGVAIAGRL